MIRYKLKQLRKNLSQQEVANATGMSYRTYARIERGEVTLTIPQALKLCKLFGVHSINALLEEEELRDL